MKNKLDTNTSILIVCVAIVIALGVYFLSSGSGASAPTATSTPATASSSEPATAQPKPVSGATKPAHSTPAKAPPKVAGSGTLASLLLLKENLSCSISTQSGASRSGTLYLSGGQLRANLTNGVSMINDGQSYYAWVDGASTGLKLPASVTASGSALASHGAIDPNAGQVAYSCYPWTADETVFAPPSSITFTNTSGL